MRTFLPLQTVCQILVTLLLAAITNGCFLARQLAPADSPGNSRTESDKTIYGPVPGKIPETSPTRPDPSTSFTPPKPDGEDGLRRSIADYSRTFIGIPYTPAGKQPSTGFDCSGFTSFVLSAYGFGLSPSARQQALQGKDIPMSEARPGDLIFYQRNPRDGIFHVSIVLENTGDRLFVIHSTSSRGIIVEDVLASTYWRPFIHSFRSIIAKD